MDAKEAKYAMLLDALHYTDLNLTDAIYEAKYQLRSKGYSIVFVDGKHKVTKTN